GDLVAIDQQGPSDVLAYGFRSGSAWSEVLISTATEPRQVTVAGPGGLSRVGVRELVADSLESTNEDREAARIRSTAVTPTGESVALVPQPGSIVVLSDGIR